MYTTANIPIKKDWFIGMIELYGSQWAFAEKIGYTQPNVSTVLKRGKATPQFVIAVSMAFGIPVNKFIEMDNMANVLK